ncbi:hypothetical protein LIER_21941 [Lithospermum erythrorhizon]|uniref:Uncharacterized protein n=1 Tax=Lithospermum erythrorhizon TaxID=34254 RepID=A0AAV3QV48_LITER
MEIDGCNGNNPQRNDGLDLGDLHDQPLNDAPTDIPKPVNLRTGEIVPAVGNLHPPKMSGIYHEMTKAFITSMMQQLREQLPQLRRENPVEKWGPSRRSLGFQQNPEVEFEVQPAGRGSLPEIFSWPTTEMCHPGGGSNGG